MDVIAGPLGRVIRRYLLAAWPSLEDLTEHGQLHRTSVSLVERGQRNVTVDALRRVAAAFGVPAWRILADAEEEPGRRAGAPATGGDQPGTDRVKESKRRVY